MKFDVYLFRSKKNLKSSIEIRDDVIYYKIIIIFKINQEIIDKREVFFNKLIFNKE